MKRTTASRLVLVVSGLILSCLLVVSFVISLQYQVSIRVPLKLIPRQLFLSGVSLAVQVYDPAGAIEVITGPGDYEKEDIGSYVRFDDYCSGALSDDTTCQVADNAKIIKSSFDFGYQVFEEESLQQLREKYDLEKVVGEAEDEFEEIVLLRNWARSQFRRNDFQSHMANFNALDLLNRGQRNIENTPHRADQMRPCHFFPMFYSQVLSSMGHVSRLVRISFDGYYSGHGMVEVWSNQFRKWVTMDADLNLHYIRGGVPLNVLEVHNARHLGGSYDVEIIRGRQDSGDNEWKGVVDVKNMIQYHSYFHIPDMRNDWMTNHYFRGHPKRSDHSALTFVDEGMAGRLNFKMKTDKVDDFYWTLNQTEVLVKPGDDRNRLRLLLKTYTPNYDYFQIQVDDEKKLVSDDSFFIWKLHQGENKLTVSSVNKFGVAGVPSSFVVHVD